MMDKLISLQTAIDALCKSECGWSNAECRHKDDTDFCVTCDNVKIIKSLPSAQPEQWWIPVTEESVIRAGYEGREVRFRIRGRLFAIRELAQ